MMSDDFNPYSSPQEPGAPPPSRSVSARSGSAHFHPYATATTRAKWAVWLLTATIAIEVISAISSGMSIGLLRRIHFGQAVTEAEIRADDFREMGIGTLSLIISIATAVAFLMWFHRVYRNLQGLQARNVSHAPKWTAIYFFIPFANLYRPYQLMKETWVGSDAELRDLQPNTPHVAPSTALVGWWWAGFLIVNFAGQVNTRLAIGADTAQRMIVANYGFIISAIITTPAALITITMIRRLVANQEARNSQLAQNGTIEAEAIGGPAWDLA